jgi:hypothetical protein
MKTFKKIILTTSFLIISNIYTFSQCAMCRSAVESTMSNGRNNAAVGLNTGIIYLLIAPYLLVAVVGYLWYKTSLKNKEARLALNNQLRQIITKQN